MDRLPRKATFDRWRTQHKGLLFRVVRAYAIGPHDQDDLYQEICIQLWRSIERFKGDSAETTWIYRVSLYTAMRWSKTQKKQRTQSLDGYEPVLTPKDDLRDARLIWLYEQIRELSEADRSVTLMMLDGFSYRQIAETLGITESNVGVKLNRVKKKLTAQSTAQGAAQAEDGERHEA